MDINRYKKIAIPTVEAGKMTKIVRDVIKGVQTSKQDVFEKNKEEFEPITEKLEKEIDEINHLREEYQKKNKLQIVLGYKAAEVQSEFYYCCTKNSLIGLGLK